MFRVIFLCMMVFLGLNNLAYADQITNANLSIIKTIDKNEIAAAKIALKRSENKAVRAFANMMITEHGQNLVQDKAMKRQIHAKFIAVAKVKTLKRQGKMLLAKLKPLRAEKFDTTYINAMIQGHQEALNLIKNELIPREKDAKTVEFLKETQKHVSKHLATAKQIEITQHH